MRNSRKGGTWGDEENSSVVDFGFEAGKMFIVEVFVADGEFLVSVNGIHSFDFGFRLPVKSVRFIDVVGEVSVEHMDRRVEEMYPAPSDTRNVVPFEISDCDILVSTRFKRIQTKIKIHNEMKFKCKTHRMFNSVTCLTKSSFCYSFQTRTSRCILNTKHICVFTLLFTSNVLI